MKRKHSTRAGLRGRPVLSPSVLRSLGIILTRYQLSLSTGGLPSGQEGLTKLPQGYFQEGLQDEKLKVFSSETLPSPAHSY